jgi:hypothetical protein
MFGRKRPPAEEPVASEPVDRMDPTAPKGRPTPSRKEAEAARKQGLRVPKDPKEARKAERERARVERERSRAGMLAGDERYLPARDQGPARAFARDFVDSRFTVAEYFIFVAIAVLALGFIRQPVVQSWVSLFFFAFTALIVVDTLVLLVMLNRRARQQFPDKSDRRGLSMYAMLRTIQLRRLRLPRPRVRRGGAPIVPKEPKT